jgi:hypothetical protein
VRFSCVRRRRSATDGSRASPMTLRTARQPRHQGASDGRADRGERIAQGRDVYRTTYALSGSSNCPKSRQKKRARRSGLSGKNPGSVLLSHTASRAVPSAPRSLTSEFGKGSGVASSRSPPETCWIVCPGSTTKGAGIRDPNPARDVRSLP